MSFSLKPTSCLGWGWALVALTRIRYIYKNAIDIYLSFFRVIFSSCSHSSQLFNTSAPSTFLTAVNCIGHETTFKPAQRLKLPLCLVVSCLIFFEIIPFLSSHCFMFEINLFIDGICVVSLEGWVCLVVE